MGREGGVRKPLVATSGNSTIRRCPFPFARFAGDFDVRTSRLRSADPIRYLHRDRRRGIPGDAVANGKRKRWRFFISELKQHLRGVNSSRHLNAAFRHPNHCRVRRCLRKNKTAHQSGSGRSPITIHFRTNAQHVDTVAMKRENKDLFSRNLRILCK